MDFNETNELWKAAADDALKMGTATFFTETGLDPEYFRAFCVLSAERAKNSPNPLGFAAGLGTVVILGYAIAKRLEAQADGA